MPPVRNLWLFVVSMVLVVVVLGYGLERLVFLAGAERTTGEVTQLSSVNGRCGGKRKRPCTKYYADVAYVVRETTYTVNVPAGNVRGHDRPLNHAQYEVGNPVAVVYSRRRPGRAYRDAFYDIWGGPLMFLFAQIGTLLGSFTERRRTA
jgi:hypothetical protein